MSDTIFYKLKIKKTRTPMEVFGKMIKKIKPRGATKRWTYTINEEETCMVVDFGDDESESFVVDFSNKVAEGFCKVGFPLEGEIFEEEKTSEFKALVNLIYCARTSLSEMEISDDYGLAQDYLESKFIKIKMLELSPEQTDRIRKLYDSGKKTPRDIMTAILMQELNIPENEDPLKYVWRDCVSCWGNEKTDMINLVDTCLYKTAAYKGIPISQIDLVYYYNPCSLYFAVFGFCFAVQSVCNYESYDFIHSEVVSRSFGSCHSQVRKLYWGKYIPAYEKLTDDYEKCILAYRFIVSVYEFCNFSKING